MKEKYNDEPVVYCTRCLSLAIERIDAPNTEDEINDSNTECFCKDCMSTDYAETDIETWDKMYRERYGHSLCN